jgi:ABC-type amino acid transport system permease subunit
MDGVTWYMVVAFVIAVAALLTFVVWARRMQKRIGPSSDHENEAIRKTSLFFHSEGPPKVPPNM